MHNELSVHLWNIDRIDTSYLPYLVSDSLYCIPSRTYLVDVLITWYTDVRNAVGSLLIFTRLLKPR
jgi:hypothetical protein